MKSGMSAGSLCMGRWLVLLLLWVGGSVVHAGRFSRVVIDPGHGGYDNGAKIGHIYEKHLALDVSYRLKEYLAKKGVKSELTRSRDIFLPLEQRSAVANRIRGSIFVSVHFNWASYGGPNGTETFYFSGEGSKLASAIQTSIAAALKTTNRGVKFARFKVIRTATVPAALIEGGFISTATERSRILDPRYRQRLAEAIGNGILRFRSL